MTARRGLPPGDPFERANQTSFAAVQRVDEAVVGPAARDYKHAIPEPVRDGVRNALNNLHEPVAALSFLLELKPGKALETVGRFAINSTLGVAGLFDVARRRPFMLSRRPNGLADVMGFYGVKPGAFLFLPLIGATSVRDLAGGIIDGAVLPLGVGRPFRSTVYALSTAVVRGLDRRAENDQRIAALRGGGADFYGAVRRDYLARRQAEIDALRGRGKNSQ